MDFFNKLKQKADANQDGRVSKEDLEGMRGETDDSTIDKLKELADQNDDGKINLDDAKNIDFGNTFKDAKNML